MANQNRLLEVKDLKTYFDTDEGTVKAVDGVSFHLDRGETLAVVGESGSGKSVTAMAALRLLPPGGHRITGGSLRLCGEDVLAASEARMREWRGRRAAMIFQEPMTALNPTRRIGDQLTGVLRAHHRLGRREALERAEALLRDMMIPDPDRVLRAYPFELSGGMRQRVMAAMAFSCDPALLIADEPTTALDVTVQRQVLQLLRLRARERGAAILFITHDMAVVSQFCDRVYVMYAGTVVEQGPTGQVLGAPRHPYTRGLLDGLPERAVPGADLAAIPGRVPDMRHPPRGCVFFDRCAFADEACRRPPGLRPAADAAPGAAVACWHPLVPESAAHGQGDA